MMICAINCAADFAVVDCAEIVGGNESADKITPADCAADGAILNGAAVIVADQSADKGIAVNVDLGKRDVLDCAAVATEQADITVILQVDCEVADCVPAAVECTVELLGSVANRFPTDAVEVDVRREPEV